MGTTDLKKTAALSQKKFRQNDGLFLIEGQKMVEELLQNAQKFKIQRLYLCDSAPIQVRRIFENSPVAPNLISEKDMARISAFKSPSPVLAVVEIPTPDVPLPSPGKLYLALDGISDPGNMGTIIRVADWFGIEAIYASPNSVERYNPKTVQATMGALFRVPVHYTPLPALLQQAATQGMPVYGTVLEQGMDINTCPLSADGFIVVGSESHGLSEQVLACMTQRLYIPAQRLGSESLNAAIATAITCAAFRRSFPL